MKDGELAIVVKKIMEDNEFSHWHGELLYNEDSVSQVTGMSFNAVAEALLDYAQTEGNVIDAEWFN